MKYVKTKWFPFKPYNAITIWPFVFYRYLTPNTKGHEAIHGRQQLELLIIPFYLAYFLEWVFRGFKYDSISFEVEAYKYQSNVNYLKQRPWYNQWRKLCVNE